MVEIVERERSLGNRAREVGRRFIRHENGVLVLVLVVIIAALAVLTKGATLSLRNISNVWLQSSTRGIASMGQTFVILCGGIDLSVGGLGLWAAILGASLMTRQATVPVYAIVAVVALGFGIGAANGFLTSRVGIPALIVTLGMWQITTGGGYLICRGFTFRNLPEGMRFLGGGNIAGVPVPVIIFVSMAAVSYFILSYTAFGRSVYAVGGNPLSSWLSGIKVKNVQFMTYVISGFLAAFAGLVMMSRTMCGGMGTVLGLELDSIAAVCIGGISLMGGRGTVIGAVLGVMILGVVSNGMNIFALDPCYQNLVKGAIIIGAVGADYVRRR